MATTSIAKAIRRTEAAAFQEGNGGDTSRFNPVLRNSAIARPRQKPVQGSGVMLPRRMGGEVVDGRFLVIMPHGFIVSGSERLRY